MPPDLIGAVLAGVILVIAHALPWMTRNPAPFIRNPAKLAAGLSGVHVLPHYLLVLFRPEQSLIFELMRGDINSLLAQFGLLYSFGIAMMFFGVKVGAGNLETVKIKTINYNPNYYVSSLVSFLFYLLAMGLIIQQGGGLSEYLAHAGTQGDFQEGLGILNIIKLPTAYLAILFMTVQYTRTGSPKLIWLAAYVLLIVGIEATLGSRRTPIQLILFALLSIYVLRPDRKILSLVNMFALVICAGIFVILLNFRDQVSGVNDRDALSYIANLSYNDIYMFVMYHFSTHDLWYGRVFLDFKYRFLGGLNGWPPPSLDEGVYIYNLFLGRPAEPPMPVELMANNSWPPLTFGNGYMNFGVVGVLVFNFIQGFFTGRSFRLLIRSDWHPIFLFLFLLFVFSFQVSNLKFTEMFAVTVGLIIIFGPMYLIERRSGQGPR